ncbi:uncharacterized protein B0H18DRAFT_1126260 [Fomitopsis serialis]|uniref:uncharacterized protein n=1 Tax=Fomitopsis serialis TaxID=139415 RepID=UPI002007DB0B|nr:uncharacterized protein B0H18DRAFT_1126260 [Neoantrodia serialis]KAH9913450.1 hypothetical protein B0H18DRAFT_1126260 [Neoantrodia serialis]
MVTEAQFKGLMTFWEGKIAEWCKDGGWKKLHKWVTEASSAAVIADGNQWEVYVPPLVISAMEEMAAPADIDLYRRFARIKQNDPRIAANDWFTGSHELPPDDSERRLSRPFPPLPARTRVSLSPSRSTMATTWRSMSRASRKSAQGPPCPSLVPTRSPRRRRQTRPKPAIHGAGAAKNTKTSASIKGKGKERAITIDSDADDDREPQQVVPKAKKAPNSRPQPKRRVVSVPEVEVDNEPEPALPKKHTMAATNAKGKKRAVSIAEEEEDDEPEPAVPKKTTMAASKGKGKQRAESAVAEDQGEQAPQSGVKVRPILKKAVSEIPSESEPDVTPGMDLEDRIESALEVDDYRTLVKICKAERARKAATTCDECFRKHKPCVAFDADVPDETEDGKSRSRSRTPSAVKANPRKRARSVVRRKHVFPKKHAHNPPPVKAAPHRVRAREADARKEVPESFRWTIKQWNPRGATAGSAGLHRCTSKSSLEQHEEFVVLESSSAISRELHNLRQENVELRHKYDELRRDFDDLCAHLGVGDWVHGTDPQRVEARFDPEPLPGVPPIRTTIDNDVDMDEEPVAPKAIRLSMQPDDAVAEELDMGVEEEPKLAAGPGAITLSGQTNEAEADGVDMRSAEASKMGEGSPNSPSRGLTPYVVTATPPGTGPESPKVSRATTKSPGLAEANEDRTDEVLKDDQSRRCQHSPPPEPSEAPPPLPAGPGDVSGCTPSRETSVDDGAQAYPDPMTNSSQRTVPESTQESIAATPDAQATIDDTSGSMHVTSATLGAKPAEASDAWKAVESLTFNITDILRSATDRNWLVYVPPIAISAMEELASNVSGDYKRRMDRITVDDPRVFGSGWYCATPPPGIAGAALKVPPTMGHALSGAGQSATASGPAHGVSFVLPHIGLVAMDENQSKELDVRPTPGSLGRNGQGASMTPHWEYLQESENDADHDADSIDTSEEVDELEELVIPKAGKAKGRRRAEACNPIDDDNELHGPRVPSERVAKGQQPKGKQRVQASMASSSGPNNAKRRWVPAYIGALPPRHGLRPEYESVQGVELFETAADVSREVHDLRQENTKLHAMHDKLRLDLGHCDSVS